MSKGARFLASAARAAKAARSQTTQQVRTKATGGGKKGEFDLELERVNHDLKKNVEAIKESAKRDPVDVRARRLAEGTEFTAVRLEKGGEIFTRVTRAELPNIRSPRIAIIGERGVGGTFVSSKMMDGLVKEAGELHRKNPDSPLLLRPVLEIIRFDDGIDPIAWQTSEDGDTILLSSHQQPSHLPLQILEVLALNLQEICDKYTKNKDENDIPLWFRTHAGRIELALLEIEIELAKKDGKPLDKKTLDGIFEGFSRIPRQVIGDVLNYIRDETEKKIELLESKGFVKDETILATVTSVDIEGDEVVIVAKDPQGQEIRCRTDAAVISTGMEQLRTDMEKVEGVVFNVNSDLQRTIELAKEMVENAAKGEKMKVKVVGTGPSAVDVLMIFSQMVSRLSVDKKAAIERNLRIEMFARSPDFDMRPPYEMPTYGQDPNTPKIHPNAFKGVETVEDFKKALAGLKGEILSDKIPEKGFTAGQANAAIFSAINQPGALDPKLLEDLTKGRGRFFEAIGPFLNDGNFEHGVIAANIGNIVKVVTGANVDIESIKKGDDNKVSFRVSASGDSESNSNAVEADAVFVGASTNAYGRLETLSEEVFKNMSGPEEEVRVFPFGPIALSPHYSQNPLEITPQLAAIANLADRITKEVSKALFEEFEPTPPNASPDKPSAQKLDPQTERGKGGNESQC